MHLRVLVERSGGRFGDVDGYRHVTGHPLAFVHLRFLVIALGGARPGLPAPTSLIASTAFGSHCDAALLGLHRDSADLIVAVPEHCPGSFSQRPVAEFYQQVTEDVLADQEVPSGRLCALPGVLRRLVDDMWPPARGEASREPRCDALELRKKGDMSRIASIFTSSQSARNAMLRPICFATRRPRVRAIRFCISGSNPFSAWHSVSDVILAKSAGRMPPLIELKLLHSPHGARVNRKVSASERLHCLMAFSSH